MAQTFAVTTTGSAWQEIVSGATSKSFGIQVSGTYELQIAIATAVPSVASNDYIALDNGGDRSFGCDLDAADRVYARPSTTNRSIFVRGFKVAR